MGGGDVHIAGELESWPALSEMATVLQAAGLRCTVGKYSIRIENCAHFVFLEYGADLGLPQIDADADSLDLMLQDASVVSAALRSADLKHRFEIYDENNKLVGYLHHRWPKSNDPP
jgi:hypothetical protein